MIPKNEYRILRLNLEKNFLHVLNPKVRHPTLKIPENLEIFKYLDGRTLGNIASVSKTWRRLSEDESLWKSIVLNETKYYKKLHSDSWYLLSQMHTMSDLYIKQET